MTLHSGTQCVTREALSPVRGSAEIRTATVTSRSLAGVVTGAMAVVLVGCQVSNVGPGDRDYPEENPHPGRFVELRATVPSTLRVRFDALYITLRPSGSGGCQYTPARLWLAGTAIPFTTSVPITLHGEAQHETATVTIDRFLPGRCDWHFWGISYTMLDAPPSLPAVAIGGMVATSLEHITKWWGKKSDPYLGRVDLWCREHVVIAKVDSLEIVGPQCSAWMNMVAQLHPSIPADPTRNAFGSERHDDIQAIILPDTRVVEVYLHDMDAK
jgi:hypothetical protein